LFAKAHKRTKVLDTPMPKHITEKAQRIATYNEDKKEVSQWDPVVKKNRKVNLSRNRFEKLNYKKFITPRLNKWFFH
jgi:U3 small nucleolar RNA-associated protein 14